MTDLAERERGSISLFFVVAAVAFLALIGLVVDGGGKISALERAQDLAAQAARQGAEAVNTPTAVRGAGGQIDPATARTAAVQFLRTAGVDGDAQILSGTRIQVNTTIHYAPVFLSVVGIGVQTVHGQATVTLQTGG